MSGRTSIKLTGVSKALAELKRLAKEYPKSALRALNRQGEFVMTDSKKNYCPVDEGPLRGSGHVVVDKVKQRVTLGYGGPAGIGNQGPTNSTRVGYAVAQHEVLTYNHPGGGESEYLKKPLMHALPTMGGDAAAEVKADIESGVR